MPLSLPSLARGLVLSVVLLPACGDPGTSDPISPGPSADVGSSPPEDPVADDAGPPGRWREAPIPSAASDDGLDDAALQLNALGYTAGSRPAGGDVGVTLHDEARAFPGLNFVLSAHAPEAVITDMKGRVLHRWRKDFHDVFGYHRQDVGQESTRFWRRAVVLPDGGLLAVFDGLGLVRLDADSEVRWARALPVHHDLEVLPDGDILVLTRVARTLPDVAARIPGLLDDPDAPTHVLEDFLTRLAPDGRDRSHASLLQAFETADEHDWVPASERFWRERGDLEVTAEPNDVFHTNSLHVLAGRAERRHPAFAAGNVLLSMRHLDTIAVYSPEEDAITWTLVGETALQHDPLVTSAGNVVVFDNHWREGRSRVVAFDPADGRVVWEYGTRPGEELYSETCGAVQLLRNRNLLVTVSDAGRAIELTREGDVVWEYRNPRRAGDREQYVATLFEVVRLPEAFGADWLDRG